MTKCDVIQDLLPLYVDDVASEGSRAMVLEHIKNCPSCNEVLSKMRSGDKPICLNVDQAEIGAFKTMKRKIFRNHAVVAGITALIMLNAITSIGIKLLGGNEMTDNFYLIMATVGLFTIINFFFGLYNIRITKRVKTLNKTQTAVIMIINILNTGNGLIHLLTNMIIGAYKKH